MVTSESLLSDILRQATTYVRRRSYLQAYASHSLRSVFDVNKLDLVKVAKSFGFTAPPRVDIQLGASMARDKKQQGRRSYGPGNNDRFKKRKFGN
jgi:ATP-dependent RNA helicase DDX18/HAS1